MRNSAWLAGVLLALVLGSCGGAPPALDVAADRATFDAVAPAYLAYIDADPSLDVAAKDLRHLTVASWDLRLRKREAALASAGAPATGGGR